MPKGYEDLGLVFDVANLAANQTAVSEWFDGMTWGRGLLLSVHSDGTFDLNVESRDTEGRIITLDLTSSIAAADGWTSLGLAAPQSLGYGFRLSLRNTGAIPASVKVAVQVVK